MIDLKYFETEMEKIVCEEYGDELDKKDEEIQKLKDIIRIQDEVLKSKDDILKFQDDILKSQDDILKSKNAEIKSKSLEIEKLSKFCNYKELCVKLLQLNVLNDVPEVKNIIQSLMLL